MPEKQTITALTGTVAPLVTVDTSDADRLDYNCMFCARQWKKTTPFVIDNLIIEPLGTSLLGVEMSFEIPKLATLLSDMVLTCNVPPVTITPPFAQAAYVDYLAYAIIDTFKINFGSNQLYVREGLDLYVDKVYALGIEKSDAVDKMVQGNKTLAQRNGFLQTGGSLITPLNLPFSSHQSMALPLVTLSQKLRFTFKSRALQNITTLPAAVPGTVLTPQGPFDFKLKILVVHPTGDEAANLLKMSQQSDGIAYMIHQNVRQNSDDFQSFQNNYEINCKMSGITKPLKVAYWGLIPTKLQNDTGTNDFYCFTPQPTPVPVGMSPYSPVDHWSIEANGQIIQRAVTADYNQVYQHQMYHESFVQRGLFFQTYSEYPHSVNAACGYMDYTNLNNPVLKVTLGLGGTGPDPYNPLVPQSLRLIFNCLDYNWLFFKSGNCSRTFN